MGTFPSLSLCLIVKNEEKNLNRLLDSVEGCVDEIILVDTGSTDKTKEIAESRGCKIYDFEWVDDFSKARNFSFSKATCDYIFWIDGDDVLHNKENFIKWKQTNMEFADVWFNTYNYTLNKDGVPVVSFIRERVFKRSINPQWQYALHEGVVFNPGWKNDSAVSWNVNHMRDAEDMKQDMSRNIRIIEKMKAEAPLDARMQFYYGKELFEAGRHAESLPQFDNAIENNLTENHDKLLAYQYAGYASQIMGDMIKDDLKKEKLFWYKKSFEYALDGLKIDPTRAEFHVLAGDNCLKSGNVVAALPFYGAAKNCLNPGVMGFKVASPIYCFKECYGQAPSVQIAKIYLHLNFPEIAEKEARECYEKYQNKDAKEILDLLEKNRSLFTLNNNQTECEDIVFSCPPAQAYPFDEEIYESKGMGGSETALIEMARLLKKKTNRRVIVFNNRENDLVANSGVEYISSSKMNEYLSKNKPKVHIAWRHNSKLTNAKTYLWCHDLVTQSVENVHNFDKIMCLSKFHKDYVMGKQGVPDDKIWVTRNGINAEKFAFVKPKKDPNKLVYLSSGDRGLDGAMLICDEVIKEIPDIKLHIYYGIENLSKYGLSDLQKKLEVMIKERENYVIYHGFTEQKKMARDIADASVWVHPATFIETYCITALEALALSIYPVTRELGALANTLEEAKKMGFASLLNHAALNKDEAKIYADEVVAVIKEKRWEKMNFEINQNSWEMISNQWIKEMGL